MHHTRRILILTLVWAGLQGSFAPATLLFGVLLGATVTWLVRPLYGDLESLGFFASGGIGRVSRQIAYFVVLCGVFLKELVLSSVQVAVAVVKPDMGIAPGIVAVPLEAESDLEVTTLANLISLTPGTLTIDVARDRSELYVHTMFRADHADEVVERIKRALEKPVIRALGSRGPG